jgi:hypothetical protein
MDGAQVNILFQLISVLVSCRTSDKDNRDNAAESGG